VEKLSLKVLQYVKTQGGAFLGNRLQNKTAIVTGGGKGIGKAIALAFASEGATLVVAGRDLSRLEETVESICSCEGRAMATQTDVADEQQVKQMVARTMDKYGQIDILVNNSGIIGPISPIVDIDLNEWNETLAINLTGAMLCSREVLKVMIPRKAGTIISIGSEGGRGCDGRAGRPGRGAYGCSKMGMIGLAETMAVEVGQYGIRVNVISPAGVIGERLTHLKATAHAGVSTDDRQKKIAANYSLGRLAQESEIASVAVFLASDESSAITGQIIVANCGHHVAY
jgi:NAD(P)-dependent dehydrogenase (short-subunit alcohol dehydrogenase family)